MTAGREISLAHYGVKGMQWGVRRSAKQLARAEATKARSSEDRKASDAARSKGKSTGTESLSNKEMQTVINRINLEQSYKMVAGTPAQKAGAKFVDTYLTETGKKSGKSAAAKTVGLVFKEPKPTPKKK